MSGMPTPSPARCTPSRTSRLLMSQPRTSGASRAGARPRGLLDSLLCRQLGNVHGAPLPNSGSRARNSLTPPLVAAVSPRALLEDLTCDSARDVHGFASGGRGVPCMQAKYVQVKHRPSLQMKATMTRTSTATKTLTLQALQRLVTSMVAARAIRLSLTRTPAWRK